MRLSRLAKKYDDTTDSESRVLFTRNNAGQSSGWAHVPLVRVNSATAAVTFRAIVGVVLFRSGSEQAIQLRYSEQSRLLDVGSPISIVKQKQQGDRNIPSSYKQLKAPVFE